MPITVGLTGRAEVLVTQKETASAVGSGSLPVFATPCLAALMERAAVNALASQLTGDETTVGTHLALSHDAATPVGMSVTAEAVVTAAEGRRVIFTITAWDEGGPIGEADHVRVLVNGGRFLEKAQARKEVTHVN